MAWTPAKVWVDHEQPRVRFDRLSAVALGEDFTTKPGAMSVSGVWREPVADRMVLLPYALTDTWVTSNTGNYAKLAKSDFGLGSGWEDRQDQSIKGPWISLKDSATASGSGRRAVSSASYNKNQGFYVAFFSYGGGEKLPALRCGWNASASLSAGVGLEIFTDNSVDVYDSGVVIAQGKISGTSGGTATPGKIVEMLLLPYAHNEMLIYGIGGGDGFRVVFDRIDEDASSPAITPAGSFWFEVPQGSGQVMVAPLKFPTSGTIASETLTFQEAPATGETLATYVNVWPAATRSYFVYGDPAYVGTQDVTLDLVEPDGTAFVPNGTRVQSRIKATLTTDNANFSPTFYGGLLAYAAQVEATNGTEITDVSNYIYKLSLSVPEDGGGATVDIVVNNPSALASVASVPAIETQQNRPVCVKLDTVMLFDGVGESPETDEGIADDDTWVRMSIRDRTKLLEDYTFTDRVPLAGWRLDTALNFVGSRAFASADINISSTSFVIPRGRSASASEMEPMIKPGDNALEWFRRLIETYAANWYWGVRPKTGGKVELYALTEADCGTTALITVYERFADAKTANPSATDDELLKLLVRDFSPTRMAPIANDVRVTGFDVRRQKPIQAYKVDTASMDPTTMPDSRPANWLGCRRRYAVVDPGITTQAALNAATDLIFSRLSKAPVIAQMESDFLIRDSNGLPLWRGAPIAIHGRGKWRINTFGCDFVRELSSWQWRNGTYTVEQFEA
jgi:hypothetical protein